MQWPWVSRSRLEAANGVIERLSATVRGERELNVRLQAQLVEAQGPRIGAKVGGKLSRMSKKTAKYPKRTR